MLTRNNTGKQIARYSTTTVAHRNLLITTLTQAWTPRNPLTCPVAVRATFQFARPASHYGTGRNTGQLRPSAPTSMATRPDVDKLTRAVLDGLQIAGVLADDAQVTLIRGYKTWANQPSTLIEMWELP